MSKFSEYFTYFKAKYIKIGSVQINEFSTDGTMGGNSDLCVPTEKAVKTYVDAKAGAIDAMVYKGVIACAGQPNYPAGSAGDFYIVSTAGKIGGSSGTVVEVGDAILCNTDGTTSGTQAQKGEYWNIIQTNIADPTLWATLASPTFTGTPAAPTASADTNTTQIATTAFVLAQAGTTSPIMDGSATAGTSKKYTPIDHVHPTDTSRAASDHNHNATYLAIAGTAADSYLLEGASAADFATDDHTHSGTYIPVIAGAATGDIMYYSGTAWVALAAGASGEVLTISAEGIPGWE